MSDAVIRVENLGKRYRLGSFSNERYVALRDVIADKIQRLFWRGDKNSQSEGLNSRSEFWALKKVSFEIKQGDVVGIIGRNGAGKSTLLKILSRITDPTEGKLSIKGRVASLLEVGTGFHSELTGRENIFLNGAILGMTRSEIRRKFDEIVAFAEVEKFLDTPVKRYSSGMYVRLAFAVAAHLDPEILVIDEVLAVGDAEFQKKCLGKMGDVAKGGRTVLFVSHNMLAVQSLCRRCLLLTAGALASDGSVEAVTDLYLAKSASKGSTQLYDDPAEQPGNELVRITSVAMMAADGEIIGMDTPVNMEICFRRLAIGKQVHLTVHLQNEQGIVVLTSGTGVLPNAIGTGLAQCQIPGSLLNSGYYSLKLLIVEDGARVTFTKDAIGDFEVHDLRQRDAGWMGREPGVVQPNLKWRVTAGQQVEAERIVLSDAPGGGPTRKRR
jgi:lipopolysaccharide transport system ATP-binding protein